MIMIERWKYCTKVQWKNVYDGMLSNQDEKYEYIWANVILNHVNQRIQPCFVFIALVQQSIT